MCIKAVCVYLESEFAPGTGRILICHASDKTQTALKAAKGGLASLIQRERGEMRQVEVLEVRAADLLGRAQEALMAGREELAREAAEAVAAMENELAVRRETRARLQGRILRLQSTVEATNRRIIDLKQGAVAARAMHQERRIQTLLNATLAGDCPVDEAEALIAEVMGQDDPLEQAEILRGINRGLNHADIGDRMADAGFGAPTRMTAANVLARLRGQG